jgi:hypothetical protein
MFILLVPVDPLSANHILVLEALNQLSHSISCEVVELFLQSQNPIQFAKSLIYSCGFYKRDKSMMFTK